MLDLAIGRYWHIHDIFLDRAFNCWCLKCFWLGRTSIWCKWPRMFISFCVFGFQLYYDVLWQWKDGYYDLNWPIPTMVFWVWYWRLQACIYVKFRILFRWNFKEFVWFGCCLFCFNWSGGWCYFKTQVRLGDVSIAQAGDPFPGSSCEVFMLLDSVEVLFILCLQLNSKILFSRLVQWPLMLA